MAEAEAKIQSEYDLLDPKLLNLIGVAASNWASLEFYINESIWRLAELSPALGACITSQIFNVDGRLRALLSLLKLRRTKQSTIDMVNKFAEDIRGPSEMRNRIVHDPWGRSQTDGATTKIEITANRKLRFELRPVDLADIKKNVDAIIGCVLRFVAIRDAILAEIPALPEIPPSELAPIREGPRR